MGEPTMMIAEKAADLILGNGALPSEPWGAGRSDGARAPSIRVDRHGGGGEAGVPPGIGSMTTAMDAGSSTRT